MNAVGARLGRAIIAQRSCAPARPFPVTSA